MEKTEKNIQAILFSIRNHQEGSEVRTQLEKCSTTTLHSWADDNDYDLLHHAILNNNVVAVGVFFSRGLFKCPHQPVSFPYLHLACFYGYRSLVIMLMQERPDDNKPAIFDYPKKKTSMQKSIKTTGYGDGENVQEQKMVSPLDVAAERRHLPCVRTILDFSQTRTNLLGKTKSESYADLACRLDCPAALRLLLSEEPSRAELHQAVSLALKLSKPECLDVLLRFDINKKEIFGGMNFFHVLFTYSYSFDKSWYESLVTVTSVLLRHGLPVHAFRPSRTYPLYSLLSHIHFHDLDRSAPYIIACLLLLLNSGADPNYDEVKVEELVQADECETAFGRKAYPSALHCFLDTMSTCDPNDCDREVFTKFMYKCVEILLNHGADVNYIGKMDDVFGTSLHKMADASKTLGIHKLTLSLLFRRGADPNIRAETLPICYFCRVLYNDVHEDNTESERSISKLANSKYLTSFIKGMSLISCHEAEKEISEMMETSSASCDRSSLGVVLSGIQEYTKSVWTLKRICQQTLWSHCHRNFRNLSCLPLPMTLKTEILSDAF